MNGEEQKEQVVNVDELKERYWQKYQETKGWLSNNEQSAYMGAYRLMNNAIEELLKESNHELRRIIDA